MDYTGLLIFIVIGAVAGWLAGVLMEGRSFGLVGNIIIGIIGAIAGGLLFGLLGLIGSIATAIVGPHYSYFRLGLSRSLRINPELIHQGDAL